MIDKEVLRDIAILSILVLAMFIMWHYKAFLGSEESPKKDFHYAERVASCVEGEMLDGEAENTLKRVLGYPDTYIFAKTRCDIPKQGEPQVDTLDCVHIYETRDKTGLVTNRARIQLILPQYDDKFYERRCELRFLWFEN